MQTQLHRPFWGANGPTDRLSKARGEPGGAPAASSRSATGRPGPTSRVCGLEHLARCPADDHLATDHLCALDVEALELVAHERRRELV